MLSKPTIVSVGAGNLATLLMQELHKKDYQILSVFSRTLKSAESLAKIIGSSFTNTYEEIPSDVGINVISITDDAIPEAVGALAGTGSIVVHTAGSIGLDVFEGKVSRYGVIYPLQTFSKIRNVDFRNVTFLLEASDEITLTVLRNLVGDISSNMYVMTSAERKWLHVAAIFSSNFTNFMYTCAHDILKSKNIKFELLYPLMTETLQKAMANNPSTVQTGPAVRNNEKVINEHLRILSENPEWEKTYNFVSRAILEYYNTDKK